MYTFRKMLGPDGPPEQPIARFALHEDLVHGIALMPDGEQAVSSSEDGSLLLWSLTQQKVLKKLKGHRGPVNSLCITPNGRHLITGSDDSSIRVWNTQDWSAARVLKGHKNCFIREVAAGSDIAVSGAEDNQVRIWNLQTGKCLFTCKKHETHLRTVAISSDQKWAASAALENTVVLWNLSSGKPERTFYEAGSFVHHLPGQFSHLYIATQNKSGAGHKEAPRRLLFLEGDRKLVSVGHEVIFWDVESGRELQRWPCQGWAYEDIALHPEGRFAALVNRGIQLWDLEANRLFTTLDRGGAFLKCVRFTPDGKHLVTGDDRGTISIWDVNAALQRPQFAPHDDSVNRVTVRGARALTGGTDGTVVLWDIEQARMIGRLDVEPEANGRPFALSNAGSIALSARDQGFDIWNAEDGSHLFCKDTSALEDAYSPYSFGFVDERTAVVGFLSRGLALCELHEPWTLSAFEGRTQQIGDIAVDAERRIITTTGFFPDQKDEKRAAEDAYVPSVAQLQAWDLEKRCLLWTTAAKKKNGSWIDFVFQEMRENGELVTRSGTDERELLVYRTRENEVVRTIRFPGDYVLAPRLLRDGSLAAVATNDKSGKTLLFQADLDEGRILKTVELSRAENPICIAPDGRFLIVSEADALVLLDGASGEALDRYELGSVPRECALSDDGRRVLAGDDAGRVHILSIELIHPVPRRKKSSSRSS